MSFHSGKNATIMSNKNINRHLIWKENPRFFLNEFRYFSIFLCLPWRTTLLCFCSSRMVTSWWRMDRGPSVTEPTDGAEEPLSKEPSERVCQRFFNVWAPWHITDWFDWSHFFYIMLHFCSLLFGVNSVCKDCYIDWYKHFNWCRIS